VYRARRSGAKPVFRPEKGQGFLGFILARQVVDSDSLHALLRQLYCDRTARVHESFQ
jgi:hypothetical protein